MPPKSAKFNSEQLARAVLGPPAKQRGDELFWHCMHPENHKNRDEHPSLDVNSKKDLWIEPVCGVGGNAWKLAAFLAGCDSSDTGAVKAFLRRYGLIDGRKQTAQGKQHKKESERGQVVAEFVHCDAGGNPICKKRRHEPGANGKDKDYSWQRWRGDQWVDGLDGMVPPLYNLPAILSASNADTIFLFESHTDTARAIKMGSIATTFGGADGWREEYADPLAGMNICFVPDNNEPGARCASKVCPLLYGKVKSLKVVSIAPYPDFRRWADAQGDDNKALEEIIKLFDAAQEWRPANYAEPLQLEVAKAEILQWLSLEPGELEAIDVALATVLGNEMDGDPLFTILVAPSSSAKTEILRGLQGADSAHFLGSLTARTLASGFDPEKTSLLLQLQKTVHTLVIKDFGSILAMNPDERGELLQQLRDVYDGLLIRNWGNGKPSVKWEGRLGLLAGSTGAIEREFSTLNVLGERFIFHRLPKGNRQKQADRALQVAGHEQEMRTAISKAMLGALEWGRIRLKAAIPECPPQTQYALSVLAQTITQCRTSVVRDRYDKTVQISPDLEGPARTAKALKKLGIALAALHGNHSVGEREIALLARIAISNIPSIRLRVIVALASSDAPLSHKTIGLKLQIPTQTISRICEDLALLDVVAREASTLSDAGQFRVSLHPDLKKLWEQVAKFSAAYIYTTGNAERVSEPEKLNPQNRRSAAGAECQAEKQPEEVERVTVEREPGSLRISFAEDAEAI